VDPNAPVTVSRYRYAFNGTPNEGPWRFTIDEACSDLVYAMTRVPRWERGGPPEIQTTEMHIPLRFVTL